MNKKKLVLILILLCFIPAVREVRGTRIITDTTETLDPFDFKYLSFSVGFAQTAEISITFECTDGTITLRLMNEHNFNRYIDLKMAEGWSVEDSASGSLVQELSSGKWYIMILNFSLESRTVSIMATLDIISDYSLLFIIIGIVFIGLVCGGSYYLIKQRKKPPSSDPALPPSPPEDRYCHACGVLVAPHLNYCGNCGARLSLALSAEEITIKPIEGKYDNQMHSEE